MWVDVCSNGTAGSCMALVGGRLAALAAVIVTTVHTAHAAGLCLSINSYVVHYYRLFLYRCAYIASEKPLAGAMAEKPSFEVRSSEFHNMEPRTREDRLAARAREKLEQSMLRARRGCFHKYEDPGNPVVPEPTSPMYSTETERFKRDVAGEMHQHKVDALMRQQVRLRLCALSPLH